MSHGLRKSLFDDIYSKFTLEENKNLLSAVFPDNGETIKVNGIVLYKILRISNPWGKNGIAVHKKLTDTAIMAIGGKRSQDKKGWIGCALTNANYNLILDILVDVAKKIDSAKKNGTMPKRVRRSKGTKDAPVPKKKRK